MVAESQQQQPQHAVEVLLLNVTGKAETAEHHAMGSTLVYWSAAAARIHHSIR